MKTLNLSFPATHNSREVTVTVTRDKPYPVVTAGCFTGTLAEARQRSRGRKAYDDIITSITVTCEALNIALDPPTQLVEVQLTAAELQLISDISSRAAGSPTESRRGLTDSLGDKVRQAMRDNDVPFTQWETKDITSGLRFENR